MCGILGHFHKHNAISIDDFLVRQQRLTHRGPDGNGIWSSPDEKCFLGHTRLAFLDLTENGKQPFVSPDGQVVLTFNGEIYNHKDLRKQLEQFYPFQTQTDTEVVLAAYLYWGKECVKFFEGMFAFCILDQSEQKVIIARDAFGIKPLYYALNKTSFLFASELKGIIPCTDFQMQINKSAIIDYLVYRYIPSPKTIWEGIAKLAPAQLGVIDLESYQLNLETYWDPIEQPNYKRSYFDADTYQSQFKKDVLQHLAADVPIGGFLSGGYDSSALAIAAWQADYPYETFTVGFKNWEYSESLAAKDIATQFNIENQQVELDESSLDLLNQMPIVYDEPIADISIIPTFAVSQLAVKKKKAVLSGEGADELFLGYHWQKEWISLQKRSWFSKFLRPQRDLVAFYANAMSMGLFDKDILAQAFTEEWQSEIPSDLYWFYRSHIKVTKDPIRSLQYLDQKCFMAELVLTKIDRASMANSLEVRVPYLSKKVFEQIHQSDISTYTQSGVSKFPIYAYLRKSVSKKYLARPKQGFVGPDSYYMNKQFYTEAFQNSYLVSDGIIQQDFINRELSENYSWRLWKLIVLEKWYAHWRQFINQ